MTARDNPTTTRWRPSRRLLRAALTAAEAGMQVFPVQPHGKTPAVRQWEQAATADPDTITAWWQVRPYNIGIATGPSGLLVIDLDTARGAFPPPHRTGARGGHDVLRALAANAGQPFPADTFTVTTPTVIHGRRQGLFTVHSEGGQPVPRSSHHGYLGVFFARIRRRRCGAAGAPDGRANRSRLAVS